MVSSLPLKKTDELDNFKEFLAFIRDPRMSDNSHGKMPPFPAGKISGKQADQLFDYINMKVKSTWK